MTDQTDQTSPSDDPQRDSAQAVASGLASLNRIFGAAAAPAAAASAALADRPEVPTIRPLSIDNARRALGEASADLANAEAKLIDLEAQRAKWDAKLADASRRRAKALEALRSIHADELVDGPAPRAVDNGHLVGSI